MSDKEVNRALKKLKRNSTDVITELVAAKIVSEAKRLCPVGDYTDGTVGGRLRASISYAVGSTVKGYKEKGTGSTLFDTVETPPDDAIWIGTSVEYAAPVEFGTGGRGEATKKSGFGAILERSEKISSGKGGQAAQPFLRPAMKEADRILKQILSKRKRTTGNIK